MVEYLICSLVQGSGYRTCFECDNDRSKIDDRSLNSPINRFRFGSRFSALMATVETPRANQLVHESQTLINRKMKMKVYGFTFIDVECDGSDCNSYHTFRMVEELDRFGVQGKVIRVL